MHFLLPLLLTTPAAPPPIRSANDAMLQLRTSKVEALVNLERACRGRLRHELKDHAVVLKELTRLSAMEDEKVQRAALDAHRCLSPQKFVPILKARLAGKPAVAAYAAEVSARVDDPAMVPPLLDALAKKRSACLGAELPKPEIEVCVWLTYAPGASLGRADRALREKAAAAAARMFDSPHPKVREVAVETVAASRLKGYAAKVADLIAREKKGTFERRNEAPLLRRFEKRRRALSKAE